MLGQRYAKLHLKVMFGFAKTAIPLVTQNQKFKWRTNLFVICLYL